MTAPIRILVLNERDMEHPKAGGAEIHVERLFARVAARGHPVVHYSTGFRLVARAADQPPFPGSSIRAPRHSDRSGIERLYHEALVFGLEKGFEATANVARCGRLGA